MPTMWPVMLERRASRIELRASGRRLEGHAAVFGVEAKSARLYGNDIPPRRLSHNRFGRAGDILALLDHDQSKLLARTRSRHVETERRYSADLQFKIDVPDTSIGNDVLELARRGDIGGMSFGFNVPKDGERWNGQQARNCRSINLLEISGRQRLAGLSTNFGHCPFTSVAADDGKAIYGNSLMGILRKIADAFDPPETRTAWPPFNSSWLGGVTGPGHVVNSGTK